MRRWFFRRRNSRLLAVFLSGFFIIVAVPSQAWAQISEGDEGIPFAGTDVNGDPVDIGPLLGNQVVVIKFGSIYCSSCVQSIAAFSALQKHHSPDVIKVVGINLDIYGAFRVKRFYKGYKGLVKYPVVIDKGLKISKQYGVTTLPSVVVIGKDGKVARVIMGYQEHELQDTVAFVEGLVGAKVIVQLAGTGPEDKGRLRILFPNNFTKTQQDAIYVVGQVPKPGVRISLTLNGGSRQEVVAKRKIFYIRTPLTLGSNYIEVSSIDAAGKRIIKAIVLFREPKLGKGFANQFPTYRYHLEKNEKLCSKCHDMVPPQTTAQNFMTITRSCLKCHVELGDKRFVHGPIMVGGCSPCHDFGSVPARYALFSTGADLCFGCHEEKKKEFARDYVHGPVAAGVCTVCHSPHGSNEKYNLRLPEGQLCTACHQKIKELSSLFTQHQPFRNGACTDCHDPHASDNPRFFLKGSGDDLCLKCHDKKSMEGHRHPVGVVPLFTFPGIRLNNNGELMCTSCHNPHATDTEKLLPKGECSACHTY
ncbi:MAG TPA: redoxin domain-containing protein [Proteobacteria bacterium]|nr:redoxin domain-containing protein [Pseudomonadota bacterium]